MNDRIGTSTQAIPISASLKSCQRVLLGMVISSFFLSLCLLLSAQTTPRMTLNGWGTDHISHQYATLLFFYKGPIIYQQPTEELLQRPRVGELNPFLENYDFPTIDGPPDDPSDKDFFLLPERRSIERIIFVNWPNLARVYPPGLYLYTAPEALALELGLAPIPVINAISVIKYSVVFHLMIWTLFHTLLGLLEWNPDPETYWSVAFLAILFSYMVIQGTLWSLEGFYDGLAVWLLVLALSRYRQGQWMSVLFYFSLGVFFHYRCLWYFPIVLLSIWHIWEAGWQHIFKSSNQCILLIASGLLLGTSGYFFILAYPSIIQFPDTNPFSIRNWHEAPFLWLSISCVVGVALYCGYSKEWLLLTVLSGVALFLVNTRQMMTWHALFLIPLYLCLSKITPARLLLVTLIFMGLKYVYFSH